MPKIQHIDPRRFDRMQPGPLLGIDEVGTGCIAGPVGVGGVVLPRSPEVYDQLYNAGLRDSKLMTEFTRNKLAKMIEDVAEFRVVMQIEAELIDQVGLSRALDNMINVIIGKFRTQFGPGGTILLDGPVRSGVTFQHLAMAKADQMSLTVGAAATAAKVERDNKMAELAKSYPNYGFEVHHGYPTRSHKEALEKLGACALHRQSTRTLKALKRPKT